MTDVDEIAETGSSRRRRWMIVVLLVVVAVLVGMLVAMAQAGRQEDGAQDTTRLPSTGTVPASLTSVRNDALADYDAALKTGKPIYVLFHSLT